MDDDRKRPRADATEERGGDDRPTKRRRTRFSAAAAVPEEGAGPQHPVAQSSAAGMTTAHGNDMHGNIVGFQGHVLPGGLPSGAGVEIEEDAEERRRRNAAKRAALPDPKILESMNFSARRSNRRGNRAEKRAPSSETKEEPKAPARPNPYLAHLGKGASEQEETHGAIDPRLGQPAARGRGHRGLSFVEQGTFVRRGERMREKLAQKAEYLARKGAIGSSRRPERVALRDSSGPEPAKEAGDTDDKGTEGDATEAATTTTNVASSSTSSHGITSSAPLLPPKWTTDPPDLEWWDAALLPKESRKARSQAQTAAGLGRDTGQSVTHSYSDIAGWETRLPTVGLVQHPAPLPPVEDPRRGPRALPLMLTKKERKRVRRQRRRERVEERQLQQQLGLVDAPDPKLRVSNMMRVLQDEAIANPSMVEAKAKGATQSRIKSHEMRNLAQKLTPEERKQRYRAKMMETEATGVHAALFRVADLSHPSHRHKVDMNAKQMFLSGVALMVPNDHVTLVFIEGGPKAVRKFERLMLRRIQWQNRPTMHEPEASAVDEMSDDEDHQDGNGDGNGEEGTHGAGDRHPKGESMPGTAGNGQPPEREPAVFRVGDGSSLCELVWRGTSKARSFEGFRFEEAESASQARRLMQGRGLVQHWDRVAASAAEAGFRDRLGGPIAGAGFAGAMRVSSSHSASESHGGHDSLKEELHALLQK